MVDATGTCGYITGTNIWQSCGNSSCPYYSPFTVSMGLSGCITLGPFVYGFQLALVTDSMGYSELQFTFYSPISSSALASTPSVDEMLAQVATYEKFTDVIEFSFMGNVSVYDAPLVENLHGIGYQVGGALGAGSAVAVDYNIVPNGTDKSYRGITISSGMGTNDLHGVMGTTSRLFKSRISVYDIANAMHNALFGE